MPELEAIVSCLAKWIKIALGTRLLFQELQLQILGDIHCCPGAHHRPITPTTEVHASHLHSVGGGVLVTSAMASDRLRQVWHC